MAGTTLQGPTTIGALNAAHSVDMREFEALSLEVNSGLVGTLTFEASLDDPSVATPVWFPIDLTDATGAAVASTAAAGLFHWGDGARFTPSVGLFRARCSAYTSGSTTVRTRKRRCD